MHGTTVYETAMLRFVGLKSDMRYCISPCSSSARKSAAGTIDMKSDHGFSSSDAGAGRHTVSPAWIFSQ